MRKVVLAVRFGLLIQTYRNPFIGVLSLLESEDEYRTRTFVLSVRIENTVQTMRLFPLFLKLNGRRCLIVGGGKISEGKIAGLLSTGAKIRVVSPEVTPAIAMWHQNRRVQWVKREFQKTDLAGAYLVIAATTSADVHRVIYREARRRGVLCNIVDVPELCDFYYGSVVRRGDLQIAISTSGASPSLAKRLRRKFEVEFGDEYGHWLRTLAEGRRKVRERDLSALEKMRLLEQSASESAFLEYQRKSKGKKRRS